MEGELNFHDIEKKAIDQDTKVESLSARLTDEDFCAILLIIDAKQHLGKVKYCWMPKYFRNRSRAFAQFICIEAN